MITLLLVTSSEVKEVQMPASCGELKVPFRGFRAGAAT